jgi:hypothetical protein
VCGSCLCNIVRVFKQQFFNRRRELKLRNQIILAILALFLFVGRAAAAPNCSVAGACAVVTAPINSTGGLQSIGSITVVGLGTPTAGSVTNGGTAGSTTYTYYCVGQDINSNETVPSASFTTTTGNATLSATNFNRVFCPGMTGAVAFRVLKADTSHSLGICFTQPNQGCIVIDKTTGAGAAYTANTADATATIGSSAGGGSGHTFLMGSTNAVVSTSVETFFPAMGSGTGDVAATVGDATIQIGAPATIKNLSCGTYTILGAAVAAGGTSMTFALNAGAPGAAPTDTVLTCAETTAQTTCTDTTHVVQLAALSTVDFSGTPAGTPTATVLKCTAEIDQ